MAQKDLFPALKKSNVSDNIKAIQNKGTDDARFIEYSKIRPSKLNNYPIEEIERLAESLKTWGLIHNLLLVKIDDPEFDFEILSGQRRYTAIGLLLEKGDDTFKNGIRSRVINSTDDIDKEIMLIEANEEVRNDDPIRKRHMIQRLEDLYKARAEKNGTDTNTISKDISKQTGLGERQVQRYRSVNTLIPELAEAFDNSQISLEKAASLSKLSEDAQKVIANLIGEFKNTEIDLLKKEAEKLALEKETETKQLTEEINRLTEQYEKEKASLNAKIENQNEKLNLITEEEEKLRKEIEIELKSENEQKVKELEDQLQKNSKEKDKLLVDIKQTEKEKEKVENSLADKDKQILELKEKISADKSGASLSLSKEEQQKLKLKFELQNIITDVKKSVNSLVVKADNFHKIYAGQEPDIDDSIKELINHINKKFSEI